MSPTLQGQLFYNPERVTAKQQKLFDGTVTVLAAETVTGWVDLINRVYQVGVFVENQGATNLTDYRWWFASEAGGGGLVAQSPLQALVIAGGTTAWIPTSSNFFANAFQWQQSGNIASFQFSLVRAAGPNIPTRVVILAL
jgi:hypothetical protein